MKWIEDFLCVEKSPLPTAVSFVRLGYMSRFSYSRLLCLITSFLTPPCADIFTVVRLINKMFELGLLIKAATSADLSMCQHVLTTKLLSYVPDQR